MGRCHYITYFPNVLFREEFFVEDHKIKKAAEAVMSLRPRPKTVQERAEQCIVNKRRHDDWLFAKELAEIGAGRPIDYRIDFFDVRSKKEPQSHSGKLTFRRTHLTSPAQ